MSTSPARAAAFDVLLRIEQQDAYASELLHSNRYAKLFSTDHGLATELVMGVLRWRSVLDAGISRYSNKGVEKLDIEVLTALRLAAYQLLFLDRIPGRAAVHESVELVKRARKGSAAAFANAVLRKLAGNASAAEAATEGEINNTALKRSTQNLKAEIPEPASAAELSQKFAHPPWLVERWVGEFGLETARKICEYDQHAPETTVHVSDFTTEADLTRSGLDLVPGRLLASARRVRTGPVAGMSGLADGRIVIQDEASQLVALLVGRGSRILDCCAAPGGKTRILAERNPEATIAAVELHPHRARLLRKLVPAGNVDVIQADMSKFTASTNFDRVLVDAPCSGTGTLARNPEIKWRLRPADLTDLQGRQLQILRAAMRHLAPGGRLVYSTCSLEREENEAVVEKALTAEPSFRTHDCQMDLEKLRAEGELVWENLESLTRGPLLSILPGVHPCDGFFAAILQKN
ncbi:MAG TPA: 16S rRNA (cytosine(967)-C(5))-methyltransferase RsmB [Terriglobales bacterium]|jgi:16S rRNA (cytosine967-C5)-methyltransferase|nr:16S rRNA (cytosine(967)-C(5))-methyltransferase RsmB [Terriglobales bacterium]